MKKINFIDKNGNTETVVFAINIRTNRVSVLTEFVDAEDLYDTLKFFFEGEGHYTVAQSKKRDKKRIAIGIEELTKWGQEILYD